MISHFKKVSHFDKNSNFMKIMANAGVNWKEILCAAETAMKKQEQIQQILQGDGPLDNADTSFVVFGSLARDEWTQGSDVDWTLLIDGQANPEHLKIAQSIGKKLKDNNFPPPGPTGVFGNLSFSHEIIHQIGGQNDTNRNTTQRILLILESIPLGTPDMAFTRVISGVLDRYLEDDPSSEKLPRFLLNDVVRFWRTIAVDFASKQRDRGGQGWGLRNAKLRMSRKLVFAAGMLLCFNSRIHANAKQGESASKPILEHLRKNYQVTPLEVVAGACAGLQESGVNTAKKIFSAYDAFLGILNDSAKRDSLKDLEAANADKMGFTRISAKLETNFSKVFPNFFLVRPTEILPRNMECFDASNWIFNWRPGARRLHPRIRTPQRGGAAER